MFEALSGAGEFRYRYERGAVLLRAAMWFVNHKSRKASAVALKPVSQTVDADVARVALAAFATREFGQANPNRPRVFEIVAVEKPGHFTMLMSATCVPDTAG